MYKKAGTYVIKLTVTDEFGGYATASHTVVIRPTNMPPVTDFSYSPAICKVNEKVQFTDKSVDEDGEVVAYEVGLWQWTDLSRKRPGNNFHDNWICNSKADNY